MDFDGICKWLIDNGFRRVSLNGPSRSIYMNDDNSITVGVTEHKEDKLTELEEELVKKRLVELGYLMVFI